MVVSIYGISNAERDKSLWKVCVELERILQVSGSGLDQAFVMLGRTQQVSGSGLD